MALFRNHQAMFALVLIVIDAAYFRETLKLPLPFQQGEPGPAFIPMLLALILLGAAIRILWIELAGRAQPEGTSDVRITYRAMSLIFITGVFIWTFESLGYLISTPIYVFVVAWFFEYERLGLGWRGVLNSIIISACVTITGWLFFESIFKLFLPRGII